MELFISQKATFFFQNEFFLTGKSHFNYDSINK